MINRSKTTRANLWITAGCILTGPSLQMVLLSSKLSMTQLLSAIAYMMALRSKMRNSALNTLVKLREVSSSSSLTRLLETRTQLASVLDTGLVIRFITLRIINHQVSTFSDQTKASMNLCLTLMSTPFKLPPAQSKTPSL